MHSDNRTITVGNVGTKPALVKQPDDVFDYLFDYAAWLGSDTTISTATATINPTGASAPTVGTPTVVNSNTGVEVRLSAGTSGYRGVLTCTATLADGETKQAEFEINVKEIDYVPTS